MGVTNFLYEICDRKLSVSLFKFRVAFEAIIKHYQFVDARGGSTLVNPEAEQIEKLEGV